MIYFDVTKTGAAGHRSGLTRVSARLRGALAPGVQEVRWDPSREGWRDPGGVQPGPEDWFFTAELFSEEERPGFSKFVRTRPCRVAAVFHDAIPLRHPHVTWPQSVARHPGYMKLLAGFDRIWAVSETSRRDLLGFWEYQGVSRPPPVEVLPLGADFNGANRALPAAPARTAARPPSLLCVGILEPRKNQLFLLEVCESLWAEGLEFELHIVGRVNPHFGGPIVQRIDALKRAGRAVRHHVAAGDEALAKLYAGARATVFPTIAEGCGLPLLESLWCGVPCVCSDLPVLRENADGGGCLPVALNDAGAWRHALRSVLGNETLAARLAAGVANRQLPTWAETARAVREGLEQSGVESPE